MADNFEADIDAIFDDRDAHTAERLKEADSAEKKRKEFDVAWQTCKAVLVHPVFEQALARVTARGREAEISDSGDAAGDLRLAMASPEVDLRMGKRLAGYGVPDRSPYLSFRPNRVEGVVHVCQSSGTGNPRGVGNLKIEDITQEAVKAKVLAFLRRYIGPDQGPDTTTA